MGLFTGALLLLATIGRSQVWTQEPNPQARWDHAMRFDTARNVAWLSGGQSTAGLLNDPWGCNGVTWSPVAAANAPAARAHHVMGFDTSLNWLFVFDGRGAVSDLADSWAFLAGARRTRTPPASW